MDFIILLLTNKMLINGMYFITKDEYYQYGKK